MKKKQTQIDIGEVVDMGSVLEDEPTLPGRSENEAKIIWLENQCETLAKQLKELKQSKSCQTKNKFCGRCLCPTCQFSIPQRRKEALSRVKLF